MDLAALEVLLVRFSSLVAEQRWISEIDINPLLVSPEGLIALDARVVVHGPEVAPEQIPQAAVRPYPSRYVLPWSMKDGGHVTIRPIRPEDEPLMVRFHETLSERSVYLRYFHLMNLEQRTTHERLTRICFIDYDREMALVALHRNPETSECEILGVGRLMKIHGTQEAEIAVLISDHWQGRGLGKELLARLLVVAADDGLARVVADILPDNRGVMRILEKLGFTLKHSLDDDVVHAEYKLQAV
ncbi:MAG: GNAT family N-acetyltransferase [Ignavibacteriota bacterium]